MEQPLISRRKLLSSFVGGAVTGSVLTYSITSMPSGYGSIEWASELNNPVLIHTKITDEGGLLTSGEVVYEKTSRLRPTVGYRAVDSQSVRTGRYKVSTEIERLGDSERSESSTFTWLPDDCLHQRLIITIEENFTVKYDQKEC